MAKVMNILHVQSDQSTAGASRPEDHPRLSLLLNERTGENLQARRREGATGDELSSSI